MSMNKDGSSAVCKVDRFSSLPPEILEIIFDLAYPRRYRHDAPLSRTLLPYYIVCLYRRIELKCGSQVFKLADKIKAHPRLGKLVERVDLSMVEYNDYSLREVKICQLVENLPNLVELDLSSMYPDPSQSLSSAFRFPLSNSLQHLKLAGSIYLEPLIRQTPNLKTLEILYDHEKEGDWILLCCGIDSPSCGCQEDWKPNENLTKLSINGVARSNSVSLSAPFLALYPNLTDLSLEFKNRAALFMWPEVIPLLPTNLTKLSLWNTKFNPDEPIDHLLPRFSNLRELVLGERFHSANFPSYLSTLRSLESLRLYNGKFSLEELFPLISGPDRLPHLKDLYLDLIQSGRKGESILDGFGNFDRWIPNEEIGDFDTIGEVLPQFDEPGGMITRAGTVKLLQLARKEGIECEGSLFEALHTHALFYIEICNRVIYRCYEEQDLCFIDYLKEDFPQGASFLPRLDYDSLDPSRLKIARRQVRIGRHKPWTLVFAEQEPLVGSSEHQLDSGSNVERQQ